MNKDEVKQIKLPKKLKEISGLTTSKDGYLYALSDELGKIYKLNPYDGAILKTFSLGKWTVEDDFEGIAANDNMIFAITSSGKLYKFSEGHNNSSVDYEVVKLPFSSKFNIEGLYFDNDRNTLLIASKEYPGKKFKGKRTIYEYFLSTKKVAEEPRFVIDLKKLKKEFNIKSFYPSGISKNPITNNYYIISAREQNALLIINTNGDIINAFELSEKKHSQPEGITFLSDGTMIISDEGKNKKATLTIYQNKYYE